MSAVDPALSTHPYIFCEQLLNPGYGKVERITVILLTVTRRT